MLRLISEEETAFKLANQASEHGGPAQRENLSREWFAASARVLREHLFSCASDDLRRRLGPYPVEAIGRAMMLMQHLAVGRSPQPLIDATAAGGRPGRWVGERRVIATALRYIDLVKSGSLKDRRFIQTVSEAFQVDRTTVQGWLRDRESIVEGFPKEPPEAFPKALLQAGARYHFNRTSEKTTGVD